MIGNAIIDYAPTPVRAGYKLEGWYLDDTTFLVKVVAQAVSADDVIYANWTEDTP